jgi:hypothetical protein
MTNPEYGDVVFPCHKSFSTVNRGKDHNYKSEIRNEYGLEVRDILNGYKGKDGLLMDEAFFKAFNGIKTDTPYKKPRWKLEWLDAKPVRKAVKEWTGEPLEILVWLFLRGIIEQAVRLAFKIFMAK